MNGFIKKVVIALLALMVCFVCLKLYTLKFKPKNYLSAFVNKLELLKADKHERKIVLIGGSSVGFSISAEAIQQQTGITTLNLGHNANFGFADFQEFISENLTKDDIIILSPEWIFYHNPDFYDTGTLNSLIENNISYGLVTHRPVYVMRAVFNQIRTSDWSENGMKRSMAQQTPPYIYNCLNANGDVISHCILKPRGPRQESLNISDFDLKKFINSFPFLRSHKTIMVFPPTPQYMYSEHRADFDMIEKKLSRSKIMVMNSVKENVYPDSGFFDETNHLTCAYRDIRTAQILDYIKMHL